MFDLEHLHALRRAETETALSGIDLSGRVLEVGGGDGFLAKELSLRADVVSIDTAPREPCLFPVRSYDGRRIPFDDGSFDVVFSSNVLEHIPHLLDFHSEMQRVLRPDGFAVHIVPTAAWRVATMLAHYPALPKVVAWKLRGSAGAAGGRRASRPSLLAKVLIAPRHGERGNVFTEAACFAASAWRTEFERGGWGVRSVTPCGLFYTGYELLGARLRLDLRATVARFLGSATLAFVLTPPKRSCGSVA